VTFYAVIRVEGATSIATHLFEVVIFAFTQGEFKHEHGQQGYFQDLAEVHPKGNTRGNELLLDS
jgi:hypothetical protein